MRTYGTVEYVHDDPRGYYRITAEPHVMIRVKRIFGRVRRARSGAVHITATPEVAADIQWLLHRHPLRMDGATATTLTGQAQRHADTQQTIDRILRGQRPRQHVTHRTPARPPREYQQQAADIAIATRRLLVTDDVGLGKSMTGTLVLLAPDALPALVVTLTHLPAQWVGEINKTLPWLNCHIATKGQPYDPSRGGTKPDVLVMNYHKLAGWADHLAGWVRTVIFDEAQELRRDGSHKYVAAVQIADAARYRIGLTASPVYNYGGEIHNVMQVLAPDALGSRDEFIREWGAGDSNGHIRVGDPAALGAYLRDQGLMIGRTRKEVGRELPDVIRITQPVAADTDALEQATGDAVEMARFILDAATPSRDRWRLSGELDWRLRQATGIAKATYVADFTRLLLESEDQVVMFGWHRAVYDLWADRLADFNPVFYTGEESPTQKQRSADAFLAGDSRILIMSLRAGAGLDGLQDRAHVAVFGELDWSPQVHMQCIGRLHRDGQDEPVVAYFLVSDHGADPVMAQVLNLKRMQAEPLVRPDQPLIEPVADTADRIQRLATDVLNRAKGPR